MDINNPEIIDLFLQDSMYWSIDWSIQNITNNSAQLLAIRYGNENLIKRISKINEVDLNLQDENGHTSTMIAVMRNAPGIIKILSKRNDINWNIKDRFGNTTAMLAVKTRKDNCLLALIKINKIDWNLEDNKKNTPILMSIKIKDSNIFKYLSKIKSAVEEMSNENGKKLLSLCIQSDNEEIIETMIEIKNLRFDKEFMKSQGLLQNSIEQISKYVRRELKKIGIEIKQNKKSIYYEIFYALKLNFKELIIKILIEGASINDIKDLVLNSYCNNQIEFKK